MEAVDHQQDCDERRIPCKIGCELKVSKKEQEVHQKVCRLYQEECKDCSVPYFVNSDEKHHCETALIEAVKNQNEIIRLQKKEYDTELKKYCDKDHLLKVRRGKFYKGGGKGGQVTCKICEQKHLDMHKFYFCCVECSGDDTYCICRACAHGNLKPIRTKCHKHKMKRFPPNFNKQWTCKAKNCLSGMKANLKH